MEEMDFLVGGGEMGRLIRSMDWSQSPLGPIESWSQSLRTTVSLCVASNFPISLVWGPGRVQIYNDGYWPICGGKHPRSMGQDFTECWASAWPVIQGAFERALAGETSYIENQRMFLDRNGYLEETFFTFSFSPIRDETGGVGGLFHPVTEQTGKMLNERRMRALRELAERTGQAKTIGEVFALASETLSEYALDLPFVLFYQLEQTHEGKAVRLTAQTGLTPGTAVAPSRVILSDGIPQVVHQARDPAGWPFTELLRAGIAIQVDDLESRFGSFSSGPYPEPPKIALMLPISPSGAGDPLAAVIAGVSARLPLDEVYRGFYALLAATLTAAIANAQAYEEERRRAEALAEIDQAKTLFFSNISHEFRTPLTLMLGPIEETLKESATLSEVQRERLTIAHRNVLRLKKLVNTLLDFSRIEAGRIQASYQPTDLAALTEELASMFRSAVEQAGLKLIVDCPPLDEPVYVDRDMWEKMVLNLLSNAFKHTFDGDIEVTLRKREAKVELRVRDTGVGIAEAETPHLFERFHRVSNARSRTHEGSGIGLALVYDLVKLHGGTMHVESKVDQGSTFTIAIPTGAAHLPVEQIALSSELSEAPQASTTTSAAHFVEEALRWLPGEPVSPAPSAPSSGRRTADNAWRRPDGRKVRVLLADDNADMRNYISRLLEAHCDVEAVPDGKAALAAAYRQAPDLILSDVMMPHMDGFQLLSELRQEPALQGVPVILLSARAGEEAKVEGLRAGADDYLTKPFSASELLARVQVNLNLELQQVLRKLRESETQLLARTQQLEIANKELEAFSYSVSHDLRAPLRTLDGFSQALLEDYGGALDEEGQRHLHWIREGTWQMGQLIDGMLNLSRLSRGNLKKERVDLSALAMAVAHDLQSQASACDASPARSVDFVIQDGLTVGADKQLMQAVLQNLLGNAWKYTAHHPAARIEFGLTRHPGKAAYFVRDDGAGFDMRYANKLFGLFQRLHDADEFQGNGIGLATVQRIIQRHGGHIWAEAEVEKGATFYFTLGETEFIS